MFRILVIVGIVLYVIYKVGSLFFRAGAAAQQLKDQQRRNVDSTPNGAPKAKKSSQGSKAGEYIDFEEVK